MYVKNVNQWYSPKHFINFCNGWKQYVAYGQHESDKKTSSIKKNRRMLVLSFCVPPDFRFY